ncbi:MAG: DUF1501 domain-containing protein [Planctomycetota bacterium]
MPTRIYYANATGFDTHANQANRHAQLMRRTGNALKAFSDALVSSGQWERTLVLIFSEFGRRVAENASGGTDHGQAAPMFVLGGPVRAGILGSHPRMDRLLDDDLAYGIDFRQIYATVLRDWLATNPAEVVGRNWQPLPFLTS